MPISHHQIGQGTLREYRVGVLVQASVAHFLVAKLAFQNAKQMFNPRPDFRFVPIARSLPFAQLSVTATFSLGKIFRIRRALMNHMRLPRVSRVTPHPRFIAME